MKNRKKKKTVIIVAAAFVLLAAVGTAALRNHGRSTGAGKGTEVMTAPVTRQDISSRPSSSGVLKPRNSYQVSSLVEGEITSAAPRHSTFRKESPPFLDNHYLHEVG